MGWWSLACCSPSHGRRYRSMALVAVTGGRTQTPSTGLRHPSFKEEGAGKRSSECAVWGGGVLPAARAAMDVDTGPWLWWQSLGVEVKLQALVYDILPSFLRGGRCRKAVLGVWVELQLQALVYDILPSFLRGGRCRKAVLGVWVELQLQAMVYDILPSTTAVFRCAIGSRCSSSSKFVTNNSDYIRCLSVSI